jgi:hypothetical protein
MAKKSLHDFTNVSLACWLDLSLGGPARFAINLVVSVPTFTLEGGSQQAMARFVRNRISTMVDTLWGNSNF